MSTISTRETLASREAELPRPRVQTRHARTAYIKILEWPPLHKLAFLGGDLLAITLAHMVAVRELERFLHIPGNALSPFEYRRFYIPFFAVIFYLFDGYKSPELRRPELELERSLK